MMKKQNKKRGFTIIELTIVVSVIAILSAVLIPTFSAVIKNAKRSADEQAVTTINKVLAGEVADEPETIAEVITMMAENGYDVEDYKPLTKDTYFYWVKSKNAIIIADASNKVLYPDQYVGLTNNGGDWYTLTGEIETSDDWKDTVTKDTVESQEVITVEVSSGAEFVSLMNNIADNKKETKDADKVEITLASDIDVQGSTVNFGTVAATKELTIDAAGKTIYGLRSDENNTVGTGEMEGKKYGYGMIPVVSGTVTIKDVVIDGMIVEDTSTNNNGIMGFIAGTVNGTLNLENVTIKNSSIAGMQKIGAIAGYVINNGAVNMKNVTVENVTVAGDLEVAQLFGSVGTTNKISAENVTVKNVTTSLRTGTDYTVAAAPAGLEGLTEGDSYVTWDNETAPYIGWVYAGATSNWYWYQKTGLPADRNYGSNLWSSSEAKN